MAACLPSLVSQGVQPVMSRLLSCLILITTGLGAALPHQSIAQELTSVATEPRLDGGLRTDIYGEPLPPGALARMGTLRDYIEEGSSRIIFSPDGRFVTATSEFIQPPLRLWDPETGRVIRDLMELRIKGVGTRHIAFSSDSKLIAAADSLGTVRLGSTETGRKIREFSGHDLIWEVAISADNKILRVWHDRTVWFWDIAAGTRTHWHSLAGNTPSKFRHFLAYASLRRSGNVFGRAVRWNSPVPSTPYGYITLPNAVSPDEKLAASIRSSGFKRRARSRALEYRLWDVATGRDLRSIPHHREPPGLITEYMEPHIEFSPDGKLLAVSVTPGSLGLWDVATGTLYRRYHNVDIAAGFTFAPDGKRLVTGGDHFRYWDIARGTEIRRYPQRAPVAGVAFTPDGKGLITGAGDTLYLWDTSTGQSIPRFKVRHEFRGVIDPLRYPNIFALALAPDGKTLASGGDDGSLWLWDVASGERIRPRHQLDQAIWFVAFAPDGKTFAVADWVDASIWDIPGGQIAHRFPARDDSKVISLAFSPDGSTLASEGAGGLVLWDLKTFQMRRKLRHPESVHSIAFAPDGKKLATGSYEGLIRIWDTETGNLVQKLIRNVKLEMDPPQITALAFLRDGKTLATAGDDPFVTLWDVDSGRERRRLTGHLGAVRSIAVSPDGRTLASGSEDGTALVWDLTNEEPAGPAKSR
jgi:WD40 repeat protein